MNPRDRFLAELDRIFPVASDAQLRLAVLAADAYAAALVEQYARPPYRPARKAAS